MNVEFMKKAAEEAREGIKNAHGGPFGCVIVRDGKIIGSGHNMVVANNDPTAHGEITAIRNACRNIGSFSLKGCELYTTAEPCPMCLAAVLWARIDKVYYGCNIEDTKKIGFDDSEFYSAFRGEKELCTLTEVGRDECLKVFEEYANNTEKTMY